MSRTTLAGLLGGFLSMFGPWFAARLQGDKTQPPITTQSVTTGVALAVLGKVAGDQKKK